MKTKIKFLTKYLLMSIVATSMMFLFTNCSKKIMFLSSSVVPGATGSATVKKNSNNNYVVQMSIANLAEANMLTPPKQTYIVWVLTDREETKSLGQIVSSEKLNASFETATAFKPVKIFITAENDPGTQYPGEPVVLTTDVFWD